MKSGLNRSTSWRSLVFTSAAGVVAIGVTMVLSLPEVDAAPKNAKPGSKAPIKKQPAPTRPAPEPEPPSGQEAGALVGLRTAHNALRTSVGVAELVWSESIASYAQTWANQLAADGCQLSHRPNSPYGENLYWTSTPKTAAQVVQVWAAEKEHYDHETNSCSVTTCGHYTQIVWGATTKLGCGMASCGNAQVWVCNYDPRGNVLGQKPY